MQLQRKYLPILGALVLLLTTQCAPVTPATQIFALTPYHTFTPSPTTTTDTSISLADTPLPSPTPFTYIIQAGDIMGTLAQKFGVPLDALIAANPNVSPNIMPVGQALLIPADADNPTGQPTPTPVPFAITQIQCHATLDGGLWCFALAHNDSADTLENLSARLSLISADGNLLATLTAIPPLNILPPHSSLPLTAFFPAPIPQNAQPRAQILTASLLPQGDGRYLPATLQSSVAEIAQDGRTARVTGQVSLPADSLPAKIVWVTAVAYDAAGRVVGCRRWESGTEVPSGGSLTFDFTVASLGSRITQVEILFEARP